jgi:hypothetical protein
LGLSIGKGVHEVVGAGKWVAVLHKRWEAPEKWEYWFRMLRLEQIAPATYSDRFRPADLLDLPKLARLLATVIVQDGCLAGPLRDDLACLEAGLDWFLGLSDPAAKSPWVIVKRKPLETVLDYLWNDEFSDSHASSPEERKDRILHALSEIEGMVRVGARTPPTAPRSGGEAVAESVQG